MMCPGKGHQRPEVTGGARGGLNQVRGVRVVGRAAGGRVYSCLLEGREGILGCAVAGCSRGN